MSSNSASRIRLICACASVALASVVMHGQAPAFEVASVKPTRSTDLAIRVSAAGRNFSATNIPLRELIRFAFDVESHRLIGGPSWIATERFDVEARADRDLPAWGPAGPPAEVLRMLRTLLAARFRLEVRQETRELPVYALMTARADRRMGPDIRASSLDCANATAAPQQPPVDPAQPTCGMRIGPGQMVMGGTPMPQFANVLSSFVGRVVIDRTGLTGPFDFRLSWTPQGMRVGGPPPPGAPALPPVDPNGPSIFAALQEQLGLRLEPQQAPVGVVVIEQVERPTPD